MKAIKLINDEKKLLSVRSVKACDMYSYDYCAKIDAGSCSGLPGFYGYDVCQTYDGNGCFAQKDECGIDI